MSEFIKKCLLFYKEFLEVLKRPGLFYNTMQYSQTRDCSKRLNGWNGENFYCSAILVAVFFRESKISTHVLWLKIESMISFFFIF